MIHRTFADEIPELGTKSILITGGTGSFGQALVKRLLSGSTTPNRLVIFSRDEQKQWQMANELEASGQEVAKSLRFFIGDVRDQSRLELAMQGVDTVVHAAAMKIVPTAEYNPFECIKTNIVGARKPKAVELKLVP